jgi:hypothetical protein
MLGLYLPSLLDYEGQSLAPNADSPPKEGREADLLIGGNFRRYCWCCRQAWVACRIVSYLEASYFHSRALYARPCRRLITSQPPDTFRVMVNPFPVLVSQACWIEQKPKFAQSASLAEAFLNGGDQVFHIMRPCLLLAD